jgi:hypothetical protein
VIELNTASGINYIPCCADVLMQLNNCLYNIKVLPMSVRPKKYTEVITLKISSTQKQTLDKMRGYNISVSRFIRDAIKEKIKREYQDLKPKIKEEKTPF